MLVLIALFCISQCDPGWIDLIQEPLCVRTTSGNGKLAEDLCGSEYGAELAAPRSEEGVLAAAAYVQAGGGTAFNALFKNVRLGSGWTWGDATTDYPAKLSWMRRYPGATHGCAFVCTAASADCPLLKLYSMPCSSFTHPTTGDVVQYATLTPQPCTQSGYPMWQRAYCYSFTTTPPETMREGMWPGIGADVDIKDVLADMSLLGVGAVQLPMVNALMVNSYALPSTWVVVNFGLWKYGSPTGKPCAYMGGDCGRWLCDSECSTPRRHLCVKDGSCDVGGYHDVIDDLCYVVTSVAAEFAVGCSALGAEYTATTPPSDNIALEIYTRLLPQGTFSASDSTYIGSTRYEDFREGWEWLGPTPHAEDLWADYEPKVTEDCAVMMPDGLLYSKQCSEVAVMVCEETGITCPASEQSSTGSCYYKSAGSHPFGNLPNDCKELATIHIDSDVDAVRAVAGGVEVWVGFSRTMYNTDIWEYSVPGSYYDAEAVWGVPARYPEGVTACGGYAVGYDHSVNLDCFTSQKHLCMRERVTVAPPTPAPSLAPTLLPTADPTTLPPMSPAPVVSLAPTVSPAVTSAPSVTTEPSVAPDVSSTAPEVSTAPGTSVAPSVSTSPDMSIAPGSSAPDVSVVPGASVVPTVTPSPTATVPPATHAPLDVAAEPTAVPPLLEDNDVMEATNGAAAGAAVVVGFVASPATAVMAAQLSLVMGASCDPSTDWTRMSRVMHPTQLTVEGSLLAGALVANFGLMFAFSMLHVLIVALAGHFVQSLLRAQGLLRFPSAVLFVFLFLYQGTVFSAVRITLVNHDEAMLVLGIFGWSFCVAVPVAIVYILCKILPDRGFFLAKFIKNKDQKVRYRDDAVLNSRVLVFFIGKGEWVSSPARDTRWDDRFTTVLRPYNEKSAHLGSSLQYIFMMALALCNCIPTPSLNECGHVKLVSGLLYLSLSLYYVIARPLARQRDLILEPLISLNIAASLFCMSTAFYQGYMTGTLFDVASVLIKVATAFLLIKLLLDLCTEIYVFYKGRRDRLQEEEWGEQGIAIELDDFEDLHTAPLLDHERSSDAIDPGVEDLHEASLASHNKLPPSPLVVSPINHNDTSRDIFSEGENGASFSTNFTVASNATFTSQWKDRNGRNGGPHQQLSLSPKRAVGGGTPLATPDVNIWRAGSRSKKSRGPFTRLESPKSCSVLSIGSSGAGSVL